MNVRPKLVSFRVEAFTGENRTEGNGSLWTLALTQQIQVGFAAPSNSEAPFHAVVKVELNATAHSDSDAEHKASFKGEYIARFSFPLGTTEVTVTGLIDHEPGQYMLVAQVYPLAMTHFRRELTATGFDGSRLPLGI